MKTQEVFEQKVSSCKTREKRMLTYVMQGSAIEKALDIYHLIIAPTYDCNLRCKHCYLPNHAKNILPRDIVLNLVDEWSNITIKERGLYGGIFHIKGGEPFVVPYLWNVLDRLAELKTLRIFLTTNGTFGSEQLFRKLEDYNDAVDGHFTIIVSLDGATEEINAKIRGKSHYRKALSFLEGLQRYRINFHLNCVLHKGNIDEILEYMNLAKKYEASQVNFLNFIPKGNGCNLREWQLPHLELYKRLEEVYENVDEETKKMLVGSLPDIKYREMFGGCSSSRECVAGYRGLLYITPDGSVFPCPNIVFTANLVGNVFNQSLERILNNLKNFYTRLEIRNRSYMCVGEKMFYEERKDIVGLESLIKLSSVLNRNYMQEKLDIISYCFSKNY